MQFRKLGCNISDSYSNKKILVTKIYEELVYAKLTVITHGQFFHIHH